MLYIGGVNLDTIDVSDDYGQNWNQIKPTFTPFTASSVSISASGQYMAAGLTNGNTVFISTDYGTKWHPKVIGDKTYDIGVSSVVVSKDGKYIIATTTDSVNNNPAYNKVNILQLDGQHEFYSW